MGPVTITLPSSLKPALSIQGPTLCGAPGPPEEAVPSQVSFSLRGRKEEISCNIHAPTERYPHALFPLESSPGSTYDRPQGPLEATLPKRVPGKVGREPVASTSLHKKVQNKKEGTTCGGTMGTLGHLALAGNGWHFHLNVKDD